MINNAQSLHEFIFKADIQKIVKKNKEDEENPFENDHSKYKKAFAKPNE